MPKTVCSLSPVRNARHHARRTGRLVRLTSEDISQPVRNVGDDAFANGPLRAEGKLVEPVKTGNVLDYEYSQIFCNFNS